MLKMITKTAIVAGAALMLLACQDKNPLLGEWVLDKSSDVKAYDLKMAEVRGQVGKSSLNSSAWFPARMPAP